MTRRSVDVAIVGAGFAGTILARVLAKSGLRILLLDRQRHPRHAFGESSTPLAALLLERIAERAGLSDLAELATWGRFRAANPGLRVGLKRGFTFYAHPSGRSYSNGPANGARLLVAASPDDALGDVQHHRADLDAALVRRAAGEGIEVWEGVAVGGVEVGSASATIEVSTASGRVAVDASWLIDASGRAGAVARRCGAVEVETGLDSAMAGAHLEGWSTLSELAPGAWFGGAPYEEERAAVHHLVDDGWLWALRFDDGVTSVGLVADRGSSLAALRAGRSAAEAVALALEPHPELAAALRGAVVVDPVGGAGATLAGCRSGAENRYGWQSTAQVSHRLDRAQGERWLALPSTFAFADPMFSTGLAWSLLGVERVAAVVVGELDARSYEQGLRSEARRIETLVAAAQRLRPCFEAFVAACSAYFAAVSWSEIGSRLEIGFGELDRDCGFLGVGDEALDGLFDGADRWPGLLPASDRVAAGGFGPGDVAAFRDAIGSLIADRDLVGIGDRARGNLHPLDLEVLVARAGLVGVSEAEMRRLLPRLRGCPDRS